MSYLFDTNIVIYYFDGLTADDALHQLFAECFKISVVRCTAAASPSTSQRARLHRPRYPSAPLFGGDHTSRHRYRPFPSQPGHSGWLGWPIHRPAGARRR